VAACAPERTQPSEPTSAEVGALPLASSKRGPLDISPASYDFRYVAPGGSATQTFTIRNDGDRATSGLQVAVTGPVFSVAPGADACSGLSLGKGRTCAVTVTFAPGAQGDFTGSLTVSSRSPAGATATAALTGSATRRLSIAPQGPLVKEQVYRPWPVIAQLVWSYSGTCVVTDQAGTPVPGIQVSGGFTYVQPGPIAIPVYSSGLTGADGTFTFSNYLGVEPPDTYTCVIVE
jgi:hypothetical protein